MKGAAKKGTRLPARACRRLRQSSLLRTTALHQNASPPSCLQRRSSSWRADPSRRRGRKRVRREGRQPRWSRTVGERRTAHHDDRAQPLVASPRLLHRILERGQRRNGAICLHAHANAVLQWVVHRVRREQHVLVGQQLPAAPQAASARRPRRHQAAVAQRRRLAHIRSKLPSVWSSFSTKNSAAFLTFITGSTVSLRARIAAQTV